MEIVGTVGPDDVPRIERNPVRGQWTGLAARAAHEHSKGRILVVKLKDEDELKKLRNGTLSWLRANNLRLNPVVVHDQNGAEQSLRVFMEISLREDPAPGG